MDSSSYKGMYILNTADFAGTIDSTAAADEVSLSPLAETDRPETTHHFYIWQITKMSQMFN